ncbi:hypothetical protein ACLBWM_12395 [Acinetobacter radioresistens]|uniref:hypothetical protein n=1 Tax=Acinetobacter radioresistens TaxID=40216 RepID=UPI0001BBB358|nr:hypothetical protein [Acinetobacter radioresistens]AWV85098.1 hypothetical protein DOM24_00285 [Acinetobacter radioresistens]EEY85587.1 hypothetical protein HMPREF0018_02663 [Acinetobacter radioresistens SH164]MCK4108263.1 glycosyltransferase family 39 protein [Acinetobacter radioresistens]
MLEFNYYQSMLTITILIVSLFLSFIVGCKKKVDINIIVALLFWHTLFSLFYYFFTLLNGADAIVYYYNSLDETLKFYPGSPFIYYLSALFSRGLDANYLNVTLVYNLFGILGLIFLYLSIKKYLENLPWIWICLLFIPSMSFWSAGLGKDAISFFSVCLFLYTITTNNKTYILFPISFFFMFMVRPHIALMMIVSFVLYFILKSRVHILFKVITLPIILMGVILSSSFVQQYVGLEETSVDSLSSYVDQRQGYNQSGGSSIDLQSMSYPMQIFTYIFRPLPFDAHSALALFTSIENTILLFLFIYILFKSKFRLYTFIEGKNTWLLIYAFLTCSMLAITTANLGIATRQKWMFMPIFLYLLIYTFYQYKQNHRMISIKK